MPVIPLPLRPLIPAFGLALMLPGCATGPAAQIEWQLSAKLAPGSSPDVDVAALATRIAGQPVRYRAAAGGGWHGLVLGCTREADCEAALGRLQADTERFTTVERVDRQRRHGAPAAASS